MKTTISRDIILDLLPLYQAEELSEDSRQLIDSFLSQDKEFARMIDKLGWGSAEYSIPKPERELETFNKVRHMQHQYNTFLAFAMLLTLLFIMAIVSAGIFDEESLANAAIGLFLVGSIFWVGVANISRQLNQLD